MAYYAYKEVRDLLPEYITSAITDYEGGCDYNGDMWTAAANYIDHLTAMVDRLNSKLPEEQRETY